MTQNEIIEMAVQAGMVKEIAEVNIDIVEAFANLVAQEVRDRIMFGSRDDWVLAEREACAKVCDELKPFGFELKLQRATADDCATAIRARGEQA